MSEENDGNKESSQVVNIDEMKFNVLMVVDKPDQFKNAGSFLTRRDWPTQVVSKLQDTIQFVVQHKPLFVLVSVNHSNPKVSKLPMILAQSFNSHVVGFAERNDGASASKLRKMKVKYKITGTASGPSIHRQIKKFLKDIYDPDDEKQKDSKDFGYKDKADNNIKIKGSNRDSNYKISSASQNQQMGMNVKGGNSESDQMANIMNMLNKDGSGDSSVAGSSYDQSSEDHQMNSIGTDGSDSSQSMGGSLSENSSDMSTGNLQTDEQRNTGIGGSGLNSESDVKTGSGNFDSDDQAQLGDSQAQMAGQENNISGSSNMNPSDSLNQPQTQAPSATDQASEARSNDFSSGNTHLEATNPNFSGAMNETQTGPNSNQHNEIESGPGMGSELKAQEEGLRGKDFAANEGSSESKSQQADQSDDPMQRENSPFPWERRRRSKKHNEEEEDKNEKNDPNYKQGDLKQNEEGDQKASSPDSNDQLGWTEGNSNTENSEGGFGNSPRRENQMEGAESPSPSLEDQLADENKKGRGFDGLNSESNKLKETEDVAGKGLSGKEKHSALFKAVNQAMEEVCEGSNSQIIHIGDNEKIHVFAISSKKHYGYLVLGFQDEHMKNPNSFLEAFRHSVNGHLEVADESMYVDIELILDFEKFNLNRLVNGHSSFDILKDHRGVEVVAAFFETERPIPDAKECHDKDFSAVDVKDISSDQKLNFEAYIHFQKNEKFFKYVSKGGLLLPKQKENFESHKVNEVFIHKKDIINFKTYLANIYFSSIVDDILKKKKSA